ncbi:MAG: phage tail tape measure protein, partial [Oscillospiraceae bacterium]|nr:phage tail tape measure protein [Oscillospiraceae bacterium]
TSVSQLGEAMLQIGATATFMKGGAAEVAQVLGIMADNGIKGAEGGTHLRNMLLSLAAPTDKAATLLEDLGVNIFDSEGNMRSFVDIFADFNKAMAGWTEADKISAFDTLFNTRDTAAALALMNTEGERWEQVGDAIDGAAGSAQKMADVQLDNLAGDITLLNSAMDGFKIAISDQLAPVIREVMPQLIEIVGQLTEKVKGADFSGLADKIVNLADKVYNFAVYLMDNGESVINVIKGIAEGFIAWKGITVISKLTGEVSSLFGWISKLGGFLGISGGAAAAGAGVVALSVATIADRISEVNSIGFLGAGHSMEDYAGNVANLEQQLASAKEELENLALYGGDLTMAQDTVDLLTIALQNARSELENMANGGTEANPAETMTEAGTAAEEGAEQVADASEHMLEAIEQVSDAVTNEFAPGMDEMSQKAAEETENVNNVMGTNLSIVSANAAIWGQDIMISFANGIIAGHNAWLLPALESVAQTVTDYLGHSHPKRGPMEHDNEWMPDMMKSFTHGIKEYTPDHENAIITAFDIRPLVSAGMSLGDVEKNVSVNMNASGRIGGQQIVVPLSIDGREIARATAWSMGEQLAWEELA